MNIRNPPHCSDAHSLDVILDKFILVDTSRTRANQLQCPDESYPPHYHSPHLPTLQDMLAGNLWAGLANWCDVI
jgi:hypothetical protein